MVVLVKNSRRQTKRARLTPLDRAFWIVLSRGWSRWADARLNLLTEGTSSFSRESAASTIDTRGAPHDLFTDWMNRSPRILN